ncbi:hypothetical protein [Streptomyces sp. NPDC051636]|uniref:hypothetical protein n=1 Tax=Streptomyces sp. NPDC051636 TaxID=3365663 RepID=UPI0037A2FAF7
MTTDAAEKGKRWDEDRADAVSAPCGPPALIGTHWMEDYPEGRLPDIPGPWTVDGDAVVLTATGADGLTVDGRPFSVTDHSICLFPPPGNTLGAAVAAGERRPR